MDMEIVGRVGLELYQTRRKKLPCREQETVVAPFKAESTGKQWLGDGYYFWVESMRFAELWGRRYGSEGYTVLKCHLGIERDDLLDLVGSPRDQEKFFEFFEYVNEKLEGTKHELTVSVCINWMQENKLWHWLATKFADYGKEKDFDKHSTPVSDTGEVAFLSPRIQLCLHVEPTDIRIQFSSQGLLETVGPGNQRREFKQHKLRVIK